MEPACFFNDTSNTETFDIPIADLLGSTYGYEPGDRVVARFQQATSSSISDTVEYKTPSTIITTPYTAMKVPTASANSLTGVTIAWTRLTATVDIGNTAITYYIIEQSSDAGVSF
jgi:hypothetical protein